MVRLEEIDEEINKKVAEALEGVGIDGVEIMQNSVAVAGGWLRDHIDYNVKKDGKDTKLSFVMPEYAKYVEYGTPPHFPPIAAIKDWCVKVGIPSEAAYPIAVKISKVGTRPQPFIRPFFNTKLKKVLRENLEKAFNRTA